MQACFLEPGGTWSEVQQLFLVREIVRLSFFVCIHTVLLPTKILRVRSEPSLREQVELRLKSIKLALSPSDMLILRNTPHSLPTEIKSRPEGRSR